MKSDLLFVCPQLPIAASDSRVVSGCSHKRNLFFEPEHTSSNSETRAKGCSQASTVSFNARSGSRSRPGHFQQQIAWASGALCRRVRQSQTPIFQNSHCSSSISCCSASIDAGPPSNPPVDVPASSFKSAASPSLAAPVEKLDSGTGGNGSSFNGGGNGGWRRDGDEGGDEERSDVWIKKHLTTGAENFEKLPDDIRRAARLGYIGMPELEAYLKTLSVPALGWMVSLPGFRERCLADSTFLFKLAVQEAIGNGTAALAEVAVRGEHFWDEIEYFISDLTIGTILEAMFVWLMAPQIVKEPASATQTAWQRYISRIPAHAFEKNRPDYAYTMADRLLSFWQRGVEYAAMGFTAGVAGSILTAGLTEAKKVLVPTYEEKRKQPNVILNSLGWAFFLACSSNPRFQLVEGMERGMNDNWSPNLAKLGVVTVRLVNNLIGGATFIQTFRWLGLQETEEGVASRATEEPKR